MKKTSLLIIGLGLVLGLIFLMNNKPIPLKSNVSAPKKNSIAKNESLKVVSPSLFVPYWTISAASIDATYPHLLYFGLGVNESGINTLDDGYSSLSSFQSQKNASSTTSLVIRMTNSEENFTILEKKEIQKKIIEQSIGNAMQYGFDGIVLDLEVSSLPFDSIVSQINNLVSNFSKSAHAHNLSFSLTLFGDTFSRIRPYDVGFLGKQADAVYVMAYDYHKANRAPGPNFPFSKKDVYGYDFKTMISDFTHLIPKEKLVIVFGMFGYDWTLNDDGETIGVAKPLSLFEIQKNFYPECRLTNCIIAQDPDSLETKITYTDDQQQKHVVWFEDTYSMEKKRAYLEKEGIYGVGYWAYSFF